MDNKIESGKKHISTQDGKFRLEIGNNRVVALNEDNEEKLTIEESNLQIKKFDTDEVTFNQDRNTSFGVGIKKSSDVSATVNVAGSTTLGIGVNLIGTGNEAAGQISFAILNWSAYEDVEDYAHLIEGPSGSGGSVSGVYGLRQYQVRGEVDHGPDNAMATTMCIIYKDDGSTHDIIFRAQWLELRVKDQVTTGVGA